MKQEFLNFLSVYGSSEKVNPDSVFLKGRLRISQSLSGQRALNNYLQVDDVRQRLGTQHFSDTKHSCQGRKIKDNFFVSFFMTSWLVLVTASNYILVNTKLIALEIYYIHFYHNLILEKTKLSELKMT